MIKVIKNVIMVMTLVAGVIVVGLLDGPVYPQCVNEDGSGGPTPCIWRAESQGNGTGQTVIVKGDE